MRFMLMAILIMATAAGVGAADPLPAIIDLNIDESGSIALSDGSTATVRLLAVETHRDPVMDGIDAATATLELNGERVAIACGNYSFPVTAGGAQADCPAIGAYVENAQENYWEIDKAARFRLWPADSLFVQPGTFGYPLRQRWFASQTWIGNQPVSRNPAGKIYYHAGADLGGAEGLDEVIAATDGQLVQLGEATLDPALHPPVKPRADVLYILDGRGWYYRYSHLKSIDPALRLGERVRQGQRLGHLGKEGASGGWSHLHFEIKSLMPSGRWGTQDAYVYLMQAYREAHDPPLLAVAQPRRLVRPGDPVTLDGSRSWIARGPATYAWTLSDGSRADGARVIRRYDRPGIYSEILTVTDARGNTDTDFALVRVADNPSDLRFGIHAAYWPSLGIAPGDPVVFMSRGRGAPPRPPNKKLGAPPPPGSIPTHKAPQEHPAKGYGTTTHHFARPGEYIVTVTRNDPAGDWTTRQHLRVTVESN